MIIQESNCHCSKSSRHTRLAIRNKVKKNLEENLVNLYNFTKGALGAVRNVAKTTVGNIRAGMKEPITDKKGNLTSKGKFVSALAQGGFRYFSGLGATNPKTGALLPTNMPTPQSLATGGVARSLARIALGIKPEQQDDLRNRNARNATNRRNRANRRRSPLSTETSEIPSEDAITVIPQAGRNAGQETSVNINDIPISNIHSTLRTNAQLASKTKEDISTLEQGMLPRSGIFGKITDILTRSRTQRAAASANLSNLEKARLQQSNLERQRNLLRTRGAELKRIRLGLPKRPDILDKK